MFASDYVADELVRRNFDALVRGELWGMFELQGVPDASQMIGTLYERFMHRLWRTSSRPQELTMQEVTERGMADSFMLHMTVERYQGDWNGNAADPGIHAAATDWRNCAAFSSGVHEWMLTSACDLCVRSRRLLRTQVQELQDYRCLRTAARR